MAASASLLIRCRTALGLTQQQFGALFQHTKRTIQRWETSGTSLLPEHVAALARTLVRVDPKLAIELAEASDTTLEALGISADTPPPARALAVAVDGIVQAAADAIGITPNAVRPAIVAAFARAQEAGLEARAVVEELVRK